MWFRTRIFMTVRTLQERLLTLTENWPRLILHLHEDFLKLIDFSWINSLSLSFWLHHLGCSVPDTLAKAERYHAWLIQKIYLKNCKNKTHNLKLLLLPTASNSCCFPQPRWILRLDIRLHPSYIATTPHSWGRYQHVIIIITASWRQKNAFISRKGCADHSAAYSVGLLIALLLCQCRHIPLVTNLYTWAKWSSRAVRTLSIW